MIKKQLNLFLIAIGFFTRIPVTKELDFSQQNLNQASRYFSLVGWLIGVICALVFYVMSLWMPISISILVSMTIGFFLTGGFHEDGLADTCDGLGGGWTVDDKLKIMKDSRIGSYGSLALWSILSLKFFLLLEIAKVDLIFSTLNIYGAILIAHPLSRSLSTALIYVLPYVTDGDLAKVKPLAESSRISDLLINLFVGCIGLLLLDGIFWFVVLSQLGLFVFLRWFFNRQVKGFTGDMLGAAQQLSEVLAYAVVLSSLSINLGVMT